MPAQAHKITVLIAGAALHNQDITGEYLARENFTVRYATLHHAIFDFSCLDQVDFILLDLELPTEKGLRLLKEIRMRSTVPVMVISSLRDDRHSIYTLSIGADDYLVKPFSPAELIARIHVIFRRLKPQHHNDNSPIYRTHNVEINHQTQQVFIGSQRKEITTLLTPTEYKLLLYIIRQPIRIFSRAELLHACLPDNTGSERAVDVHISNLRRKLEEQGLIFLLESVRGFGYRLGNGG